MKESKSQNSDVRSGGIRKPIWIISTAILVVAASAAIAQSTQDGPIQVNANEIDIQPQNNLAFFNGNAEFTQNGYVIRSEKFKVVYREKGSNASNKIDKLYADSETVLVSAEEKVRADRLVYDGASSVATFYGNVILTQKQNVISGDELRINTKTKQSTIKSSGGKVRAVFFPEE